MIAFWSVINCTFSFVHSFSNFRPLFFQTTPPLMIFFHAEHGSFPPLTHSPSKINHFLWRPQQHQCPHGFGQTIWTSKVGSTFLSLTIVIVPPQGYCRVHGPVGRKLGMVCSRSLVWNDDNYWLISSIPLTWLTTAQLLSDMLTDLASTTGTI